MISSRFLIDRVSTDNSVCYLALLRTHQRRPLRVPTVGGLPQNLVARGVRGSLDKDLCVYCVVVVLYDSGSYSNVSVEEVLERCASGISAVSALWSYSKHCVPKLQRLNNTRRIAR